MDETQNDAPFVAFYDMHAVTFVPPDEMADVTIAGLQWFILIPPIKPHGVNVLVDILESACLFVRPFVYLYVRLCSKY